MAEKLYSIFSNKSKLHVSASTLKALMRLASNVSQQTWEIKRDGGSLVAVSSAGETLRIITSYFKLIDGDLLVAGKAGYLS